MASHGGHPALLINKLIKYISFSGRPLPPGETQNIVENTVCLRYALDMPSMCLRSASGMPSVCRWRLLSIQAVDAAHVFRVLLSDIILHQFEARCLQALHLWRIPAKRA